MVLEAKERLTVMKDNLFTVLSNADYGELFPYKALGEIMNDNPVKYRYVIHMVAKRLEREAQRTLESIRGHGYRVALPKDHLNLSAKRQQRGRRQIDSAVRVLRATPVALLSPEEQRRHGAFLTLLHQQADVLRSMKVVVHKAHESITTFVEDKLQESMQRIQALEDRLSAEERGKRKTQPTS